MRIAVILPAITDPPGGVQRFAGALLERLRDKAEVETFRVHGAGRSAVRAIAHGWRSLARAHHRRPFAAVFSTFFWPWRLLPFVPMAGFVHDLRHLDLVGADAYRAHRWSPAAVAQWAILRTWDRVLVPSAHVAEDVQRLDPRLEIVVVGEGLDHLDRYASEGVTPRDVIVAVGSRAPHKRTTIAAEAISRAANALGVRGVLLGAPGAPVPANVDVVARFDDRALVGWLERARVLVSASAYEGFGLAVGEGMRFGVPTVYAEDCPISDLVGPGGLAAPAEPDAMARAVGEVIASEPTFSAAARASAGRFTWDAVAERVIGELKAVVG